jgi:mono/diheme cytochrome c family protein
MLLRPPAGLAEPGKPAAGQVKEILRTHCAVCHGGGKAAKGGFGFVLDRDRLVSRRLVVPGDASASDLYRRVQAGEMPPPARQPRPTQREMQVIREWITAGAPAFESAFQTARALSPREVEAVILEDLKKLDPRQRRFVRYLTLTHVAFAGRPKTDAQTLREAAGKLLNSLSWHPCLRLPDAIDGAGTVLRLDLRAYKWSAVLWEKLAAAYPYRMAAPAGIAGEIARYTGTDAAFVRADWFVATAARPPLYHDLLQLPTTDRALERLLQVDVPANIQEDNVQRAGFNDSGVSQNNRLIERHDAAHGALWRSYDFAGNSGRQNLFEHPLGPNAGAVSFQAAGGEIIFHLPNGLYGYMLVDAAGRRIDKAPAEIVSDPRRPDRRVETAVSCMSCHARGLLPKADQLRAHVRKNARVFGKDVLAAVEALHPPPAGFMSRIERDNARYLGTLKKLGVRDAEEEPINLAMQRFEETLEGRVAAAELGLSTAELAAFLERSPALARTFGGLLVPGGTVPRDVFQDNFAELIRGVGTPTETTASTRGVGVPFRGHSATVNCVALSADARRAVSGSDDGTVRLWDIDTGIELTCLHGSGAILAVTLSSDGNLLLAAGRDRLVRLWDLRTAKQVRVFAGHTDSIHCVAFSPDGTRAVSGGDDRSLHVWDLLGKKESAVLATHTDAITNVAWSRDGSHLLSGSCDGSVRFWDLARRKQVWCLEGHVGPVLSVALARDGKTAFSGGNDKTVRLWSLTTGTELHCFLGHQNAVVHVQPSADGKRLFSSGSQHRGAERNWRHWDLIQKREAGSLSAGEEYRFGCATFSPDGRLVLVGGPEGFVRLWRWSN